MKNKIISFFKKEIVLSVAMILAICSMFFVHPSREYLSYIDFNTLFLLFSLMSVMAGYKKIGIFSLCGHRLLKKTSTVRGILFVLVLLPFFFSMFITNDVALITFVPFAIIVLTLAGLEKLFITTVILQTLAANLGSMMLPMGNPQNLYLFNKAGLSLMQFITLMLPFTLASLVLLCISILIVKNEKIEILLKEQETKPSKKSTILYTLMFILCLLSVGKVIPPFVPAVTIFILFMIIDRHILKSIDYSLLATFAAFFIFVGNIKNIPIFREHIATVVTEHEAISAIILSQIISNVPAALLLSGFTDLTKFLITGTNLGGLGTLIASMASLISYKLLCGERTYLKGKYVITFSLYNLIYLIILFLLHIYLKNYIINV